MSYKTWKGVPNHCSLFRMGIEHTFGKNVKERRKELGMTQETLSHEIGLDQAYISRIEAGNKNVTLSTIEKISIALQISADQLVR